MPDYLKTDKWLSEILEINSYNLNYSIECDLDEIKKTISKLHKNSFITAKISSNNINKLIKIQDCGFFLIDCLLNYSVTTKELINYNNQSVSNLKFFIRESLNEEKDYITEIASKSFLYSRFHQDPNISKNKASKIKSEWIKNFFNGKRGDKLFVAVSEKNSEVIGFILLIEKENFLLKTKDIVIDLISVNAKFKQNGIGLALIKYAANYYKSATKKFRAGTQAVNIPANRLYQKLSFKLYETSYVFHFHKK